MTTLHSLNYRMEIREKLDRQELLQEMREAREILNDSRSFGEEGKVRLMHALKLLKKFSARADEFPYSHYDDEDEIYGNLAWDRKAWINDMETALCQDFCLDVCTPALMRNLEIRLLEAGRWNREFGRQREEFEENMRKAHLQGLSGEEDGQDILPYRIWQDAARSERDLFRHAIRELERTLAARESFFRVNDWNMPDKVSIERGSKFEICCQHDLLQDDRDLLFFIQKCEILLAGKRGTPEYEKACTWFREDLFILIYNVAFYLLDLLEFEKLVRRRFADFEKLAPYATFNMKLAWFCGREKLPESLELQHARLMLILEQPMRKLGFFEACGHWLSRFRASFHKARETMA